MRNSSARLPPARGRHPGLAAVRGALAVYLANSLRYPAAIAIPSVVSREVAECRSYSRTRRRWLRRLPIWPVSVRRSARPTRPGRPRQSGWPAAAADDVSAQVAAFFSEHGLGYQQISAQIGEVSRPVRPDCERGCERVHGGRGQRRADPGERGERARDGGAGASAARKRRRCGSVGRYRRCGRRRRLQCCEPHRERRTGLQFPGWSPGCSAAISWVAPVFLAVTARLQFKAPPARLLRPTGGISALTAASALLAPAAMTNAAVVPAALQAGRSATRSRMPTS